MNTQDFIDWCNKDTKLSQSKFRIDETFLLKFSWSKNEYQKKDILQLWDKILRDKEMKAIARKLHEAYKSTIELKNLFKIFPSLSKNQKSKLEHFVYVCSSKKFLNSITNIRQDVANHFKITFPMTPERKKELLNREFKTYFYGFREKILLLCRRYGLDQTIFLIQPDSDFDNVGANRFSLFGGNSLIENTIFHNDPTVPYSTLLEDHPITARIRQKISPLSLFPYLEMIVPLSLNTRELNKTISELRRKFKLEQTKFKYPTKKDISAKTLERDWEIRRLHEVGYGAGDIYKTIKGQYHGLSYDSVRQSIQKFQKRIMKIETQ